MKVILSKKPKEVNILAGFPTFGVIGPIVSEYLLENLTCEKIGEIETSNLQPMVAIHKGVIVKPIEIYYNKRFNLVIVRSVSKLEGVEWELAEALKDLATQLSAWELLSIEGIADQTQQTQTRIFGFSNDNKSKKKLNQSNIDILTEGIILGLTAALFAIEADIVRHTTFFATTHSQLPDSHAAAEIIKVLDIYLGLDIDPEPLLEQAQGFESELSQLHETTRQTEKELKLKKMSYVG